MHTHSKDKSKEFSKQALDLIEEKNLTPYPEIYEVWYVHHSGEDPEISHAIELLQSADKELDDEQCFEIYSRFLSDSQETEKVREAGDKIQNTIKDVNSIVSNVKNATSKYSASLNNVVDSLQIDIPKDQLEALLSGMLEETQDILAQNMRLESQLSHSSEAMEELKRDLEIVRKEAFMDGLTGLSNRKSFDEAIVKMTEKMNAEEGTYCLVMMDIDYFKSFNDNFGHQVGDQVLRLVARTLIEGVKGRDVAARYGGEEFALLLPDTNMRAAQRVADSLRLAVASKEVVNRNSGDKLGRITLSGGVAEYSPGESVDEIISRADAALYKAKENGRNQIVAAANKA